MSVTVPLRTLVTFAAGVAAAVIAVFVFQALRVDAAPGDSDATFVPITPCRLIDTRPDTQVGPRDIPIGEAVAVPFTAWDSGDDDSTCEIPDSATSISTNTTIVNPTRDSFLTLYPADEAWPGTANLNYVAGQAPTPNAVTIPVSPTGKFNVFNRFGGVDVIVDINGYYTRTSLRQLQSQIDALKAADIALEAAQPFAVSAFNRPDIAADVLETPGAFVSVSVTAPVAGQVTINSTASVFESFDGKRLACAIYETPDIPAESIENTPSFQGWQTGGNGRSGTLSGTRTFDIAAGATISYSLACEKRENTTAFLSSSNLTAIFTPAP